MSPNFLPLSAERLEEALALRRELYAHEDIVYHAEDAARRMRELMEHPEFGAVWLIEVDGETAGYLILTVCYSLEFHGRFGLLDEFFVAGGWRGKGVGGAALDFAERECGARGLEAIRLEAMHANRRALELYRRRGFATEPRHLMTKWL